MVDARVIALVLGVVGLAFGVGSLALDVPVLGLVAGLSALAAGAAALAARPTATGAADVVDADRDQVIDRTRRELAETRVELDSVRRQLADAASDQPAAVAAADNDPTPDSDPTVNGAGPGGPVTSVADASALTDAASQLFSEAYFVVALQSRLAAARRHLRPVSVCLMQVAEGQVEDASRAAPPPKVADSIRQTLREADIACRLDDGTYAVILEDTPENGAVWTVERTRRNLVSRSGPHTMWAGVACYPAHAFSGPELIDQARAALVAAQEWNQDRIEVAVVEG